MIAETNVRAVVLMEEDGGLVPMQSSVVVVVVVVPVALYVLATYALRVDQ